MPKGESALRIPGEKGPKRYTAEEIEKKMDQTPKHTGGSLDDLKKELAAETQKMKELGYEEYTRRDRRRQQDIHRIEAVRRKLGGLTGEGEPQKFLAKLREEEKQAKQRARKQLEDAGTWLQPHQTAKAEKERAGYRAVNKFIGQRVASTPLYGTSGDIHEAFSGRSYLAHSSDEKPLAQGAELTDEEAVHAYLDRDMAKKATPAEKLLEKLLRSEQKIYLDNEDNVATILADKTLLAALEIQKWNGSKNILAQVAAEMSLEKSDELVALEQKKGWLKRLFKSPEEKRLAQEMRALDDLIKTLSPGSKSEPVSPQAKRLIDTMIKR